MANLTMLCMVEETCETEHDELIGEQGHAPNRVPVGIGCAQGTNLSG